MEFLRPLFGLIPFFLSVFVALGVALAFKKMRKRSLRQSPLAGKKLEHVPGQQLLNRMQEQELILDFGVNSMILSFPMVFLIWAGMRINWHEIRPGFLEWFCVGLGCATFVYGAITYMKSYSAREKVRDGLIAERVTGLQLNRLTAQSCLVMHDLPCENFNIDHVVIAPKGVFAVETKSMRKPAKIMNSDQKKPSKVYFDGQILRFPDWSTNEPVEQARRQAQWLAQWLTSALGRKIPVIGAVALPGWYVERTDAAKRSDVQVFTPMGRGAEFMAWSANVLTETDRHAIAAILASRYPQITD